MASREWAIVRVAMGHQNSKKLRASHEILIVKAIQSNCSVNEDRGRRMKQGGGGVKRGIASGA